MGDIKCITLGDYGRIDNLDDDTFGFHPMNPVAFNIKNHVLKFQVGTLIPNLKAINLQSL